MPRDRMSISWDDLKSDSVEKKLQQQDAISQAREHYDSAQIAAAPSRKPRFTLIYNTVFYMGLFGALGGLLGWGFGILFNLAPTPNKKPAPSSPPTSKSNSTGPDKLADLDMVEKQAPDNKKAELESDKQNTRRWLEKQLRGVKRDGRGNDFFELYLRHHTGDMDDKQYAAGRRSRRNRQLENPHRQRPLLRHRRHDDRRLPRHGRIRRRTKHAGRLIQGSVGALVGLIGGIVVSFFDERIYNAVVGTQNPRQPAASPSPAPSNGASSDYSSASAPACFSAISKNLSIGLIAGLIGGIVGGLLFEPMKTFAERFVDNGEILSRLIGLLAIGIVAGVGTGLIENAVKSGWFKVTEGLIAGKQFVLYRNPTYIGILPNATFTCSRTPKSAAATPPSTSNRGFEIEDLPLGTKTLVNGKPIQRAKLRAATESKSASTAFVFQEKAKTPEDSKF